jgi:hypothetical protein
MSEIFAQIQEAEAQIENAKIFVAQRDRLLRLTGNLDFQKLIIEGFCKDECARYCHMSTEPGMDAQDRADSLAAAQAGGHLKRWINALILMGNRAEKDSKDCEELLAELRALPEDGE